MVLLCTHAPQTNLLWDACGRLVNLDGGYLSMIQKVNIIDVILGNIAFQHTLNLN